MGYLSGLPARLLLCMAVFAGIVGAVFGSFLNCAAFRIARGESFIKGRSRCPHCGHELSASDLIPVLSWVFLRGRCRYCGTKISPRYVISELLFAAVSIACVMKFGLTLLCLRNWIYLACLFCLSLVDMDSFTIPDGCLIIPAIAWIASAPFLGLWPRGMIRGIVFAVVCGALLLAVSLVLDKILKKDSLGGGDIKLAALAALYNGPLGTLFMILLACVSGLIYIAAAKKGRGEHIPFGPFIAAASCVMLLFGAPLVNWYLGLMSF